MRTSNSADLEASTDLRGQLALGSAQHNVQELLLSGNRGDVLPGRLHGGRSGDVCNDRKVGVAGFRDGKFIWAVNFFSSRRWVESWRVVYR